MILAPQFYRPRNNVVPELRIRYQHFPQGTAAVYPHKTQEVPFGKIFFKCREQQASQIFYDPSPGYILPNLSPMEVYQMQYGRCTWGVVSILYKG